jgi:iron complex outermembrane recepter protein
MSAGHNGRLRRYLAVPAPQAVLIVPTLALALHGGHLLADENQVIEGGGLKEIIVTAQKRTSTLQETPISITAVTGEQLERQGISDVAALATQTPGVSMTSVGPGRTSFDIRGLSNLGGSSPTVGFYLDDVPVTPPTSTLTAAGKTEIDPSLYDLARVEVLRGPQGTLYGSGSMGGTIRLISNAPQLDRFDANGESILSGTDGGGVNWTQNGMLNLPLISGTLGVRLSGTDKYESGFIDRIVVTPFPPYTGPNDQFRGDLLAATPNKVYTNVNDERLQGVHGEVLWRPLDRLSFKASVLAQSITQGGQDSYDLPPGTLAHYQPADVPESFDQGFSLYALTARYDFEAFSVQSTSAELGFHMRNVEDTQEQWFALTEGFGTAPFFPTPGSGEEGHHQHEFTEELRATSSGSGPWQWIVGGFFSNFTDHMDYYEADQAFIPLYDTATVFTDFEPDHLKQEAAFGDLTYAITHTLKADVGLRYFHYTFDFQQDINGIVAGPPFDSAGEASASGNTPKVGLSYEPNENLTTYFTAAKGFRPGGPNLPVPVSFCGAALAGIGLAQAPESYTPDSVWSYELGEKALLLDRTVGVRGSVYYIDWSRIQQEIQLSCGYNFDANAGKAVSKGGEIEIDARVAQEVTLHESAGYTNAEITHSTFGSVLPVGEQLQDVPKFTIASSVELLRPVSPNWSIAGDVSDRYIAWVNDFSAEPYPISSRPGYNILDARLGIERELLSAYLFVDNALDKRAELGFDHSEAQNTVEFARVIPNRPRTIGIDFQYRY